MASILESLEDVAGVAGSFAIDDDGELVAVAMPSYVQSEDLAVVAPRIQRLVEATAELQVESEWWILHYADYQLQVTPFAGGMLVVLTAPEVNTRALRMAAKILGRKLAKLVEVSASQRGALAAERPPSVRSQPPTASHSPARVAPTSAFPAPSNFNLQSEPSHTFEVRGRGRLPDRSSEPPEAPATPELRNTQPSLPTMVLDPEPVTPRQGAAESLSPEARSSRRVAGPRSLVYRGRRYDVSS